MKAKLENSWPYVAVFAGAALVSAVILKWAVSFGSGEVHSAGQVAGTEIAENDNPSRVDVVAEAITPEEYVADCTNAVLPEVLTPNFPLARQMAETNAVPLILVAGTTGCEFCNRVRKVMRGEGFGKWIKGTGIYLVDANFDLTNRSYAQKQAIDFAVQSPFTNKAGYPYVVAYWRRSQDDANPVRIGFSGQRRQMPVEVDGSLEVNFLKSLEVLLGEYLKSVGRTDLHMATSPTVKKVSVAADGPGSVSMKPEDGQVLKGRSAKIRFSATAKPGHRFVHWLDPSGRKLNWGQRKGNLKYHEVDEGTYTAVFE